jgi:HKD family nuclease
LIQILNKPMYDIFMAKCADARESIKLCAPFVKSDIVEDILNNKGYKARISLVTNVNLMSFSKKSSDVEALNKLLNAENRVYTYSKLHAKYYIFDDQCAIITSANLTSSGLKKNYEYGVILSNLDKVRIVVSDYKHLCHDELTGKITHQHLQKIQDILDTLPPVPKYEVPDLELDASEDDDSIFDNDPGIIRKNLTGWKRAVFQEVDMLNKRVFTTEDFEQMEPNLRKLYPNNRNIDAKIRQQLQFLRDLGLIRFESRGVYKKLWK